MKNSPEIDKLIAIYQSHNITFKNIKSLNVTGFIHIKMTINSKSWDLYVDDEYGDSRFEKPLVALYLVLFSLEIYFDSYDFLDWSRQNQINPSQTEWLTYYKTLGKTYTEIKEILGEVDSCISSFDYQMRNDVIDELFASDI